MNHLAATAAALGLGLLAAPCYAEMPSIADTHALIFSQLSTSPRATSDPEAIRPILPEEALAHLRKRVFATLCRGDEHPSADAPFLKEISQ